jgi:hypothetical protein
MKRALSIFTGVLFFTAITGQEDNSDTIWTRKGDVSVMFSQTSFTNWAAGGENSITVNGFFNYYAGYEKGITKWENFIALGYGQTKSGDRDFRKSEDKIDFLSTYGLKAAEKWYYMANLSFKSQFVEGYEYHDDDPDLEKTKISNFMAPGFISFGLGMEYKPTDYMSFYLSPVTTRWIIVNDQELANKGAFGVEAAVWDDDTGEMIEEGEKVRHEFGANFRFLFDKEITKNINFMTKLELFSNYLEKPKNVDVSWDSMLDMKVNRWISAKIGALLLYDDDTPITDKDGNVGPRTQFKQLLAIGLTYAF